MTKCMGEEAITIQDLACGIDIQRGPILLRQPNQGYLFAVQYRFVLGIAEGTIGECDLVFQKQAASREWEWLLALQRIGVERPARSSMVKSSC